MKKYALDLSVFILIFLFLIFALSNIGFISGLGVNCFYVLIALVVSGFYLYKSGNFYKKICILSLIFIISSIFAHFFIDTSYDGRCYHFTLEYLFKLGYNPIYYNIREFANQNNIFYNILFASSYPNATELIRANFYLIFNNMESSKTVNFLVMFSSLLYSFYFFSNITNKIKSLILTLLISLCSVSICQINTKMVDFYLYCFFVLQLFSILLTEKNKDTKINSLVFIISTIFSVATKYTGLFNSVIMILTYLSYKIIRKQKPVRFLKITFICTFLCFILCFQPYITNTIKFKNPFYPSIGYNKLDFMTKQNPLEFQNKPYLYKFFRSIFSSTSDSRISNSETPKLYYKIPFTNHYDLPYFSEDMRINGFGHLFSGIFLLSIILSFYQIKKKKGILPLLIIFLTVISNPVCWWARFVPQLHILPVMNCFYLRKNKYIFYILSILIMLNGFWIMKENYAVNAYKTYVMHKFYNDLYANSLNNEVLIYKNNSPNNEDDETIIPRLNEYGVNYKLVFNTDRNFTVIRTESTITNSYQFKYNH